MATRSNRTQQRRTATPGKAPTPAEVLEGELVVNLKDKKLFTKDEQGNVIEINEWPDTIYGGEF